MQYTRSFGPVYLPGAWNNEDREGTSEKKWLTATHPSLHVPFGREDGGQNTDLGPCATTEYLKARTLSATRITETRRVGSEEPEHAKYKCFG